MANTNIQLRKSGVTGNVPASLELGELALNYADGKLYYKNGDGIITYISSGPATNSFATINSNSSLIFATSNTDILTLAGSNNITIDTDTINKKITIGASLTNSLYANSSNIGASANVTAQLYDLVTTIQGIVSYTSNQVSYLSGVESTQNNNITAVNEFAQGAYDTANSGISLAQSAYDYANTITGGGVSTTTYFNYLTVEKQLYTANASQTDFFVHYTAPYVTVVVNGATIDPSEYSTSTANTVVLSNPASDGDVVDITGFYQANSSTITTSSGGGGAGTDQWVRDTANNARANTIFTQGVDAWQNTQITAVNDFAAGAYTKANNAQNTIDYNVGLIGTNYTLANNANNLAQNAYTLATGANGLSAGAFDRANNALPLTGGTVTGNVIFTQDVTISGNLYLSGNATTISTNNVTLNDSLIYLANENPANTVDIGIVGHFTEGHYQHTGVVRNHLNGNWIFFSNVSTEPTTTINFAEANLTLDSITTGGIITPSATINGKDWQAVNNTQNTNISIANSLAQSSYNYANTIPVINYVSNNSITFSSNSANQVIDTFSTTEWRTAKYLIQCVSGADVHSTELFLTHNDSNVLLTQYAEIYTTNLMSLDASITSGNLSLMVTPTTSNGTIDVVRTSLIARVVSIQGDLMTLTGSEDLDSGTGSEDLMV